MLLWTHVLTSRSAAARSQHPRRTLFPYKIRFLKKLLPRLSCSSHPKKNNLSPPTERRSPRLSIFIRKGAAISRITSYPRRWKAPSRFLGGRSKRIRITPPPPPGLVKHIGGNSS